MKVWWCEEHNDHQASNPAWCWRANFTETKKPCRMVEMKLVPVDAIVISEEERRVWEFANRRPS